MKTIEISPGRVGQVDPTTLKMDVDVLVDSTIEAINPVVETNGAAYDEMLSPVLYKRAARRQ